MDIKNEILTTIEGKFGSGEWDPRCQTQEILEESEFFLQKAKDAYDDFMNYDINYEKLRGIYIAIDTKKRIEKKGSLKAEVIENIFKEKELDENFRKKLHTLLSYLKKYYKIEYNAYLIEKGKERDVAYVKGGPSAWIIGLIKLKMLAKAPPHPKSIFPTLYYTIEYINNPMNEISIVSEKHRMRLSEVLLDNENLDDKNFCAGIKEFFSTYKDVVNNPMNFTILCARMLCDEEITRIWQERTPKKRRSIYDD